MHRFFGLFPESFQEIADDNAKTTLQIIHDVGPPGVPFHRVARREVSPADRDFILKIMKLDPRDRPTAEELLEDEWFTRESDTPSSTSMESMGSEFVAGKIEYLQIKNKQED